MPTSEALWWADVGIKLKSNKPTPALSHSIF